MKILVLQHIACEPPGVFEDVLVERGATITRVELDEGAPIPSLFDHDALVVMGGPMAAYEDDRYPWMDGELATIADAVRGGLPVLGVCLGAQLLARAASGTAHVGVHGPEVGVLPVELAAAAADDPVFADLPPRITALQWHGDTFDLPPQSVLLAESDVYPQVFRIGTAYGIQFHVEVTSAMAEEWSQVRAYAESLDAVRGPGSFPGLLAELEAAQPEMKEVAETIAHRFVDLTTARRTAVVAARADR